MTRSLGRMISVVAFMVASTMAVPAAAQITTGTVTGNVKDAQGGVIPGATVTLISEARGTRMAPAVTNETGDFVVANVTPDTYTVEITMPNFKTLTRKAVQVSGGDRLAVGTLVLEIGGKSETVDVTAEAPLIQAQSGERSFAISTVQVENLPINHGNFANFAQLTPGVFQGNQSGQQASRLGGTGQNNLMMDGISAMDTGNNGQMLNMNIESIAEVKVLTQGYQAEYGRSSGLQITAVTKSGTNRFHGSAYDIATNSDWNANSWVNEHNGDPKAVSKQSIWGYSVGGPVGNPGGDNKLFFFYSHEYRPTTTSGTINRFRVPTQLERAGDFSQTVDNQGQPFPYIRDAATGLPCSASDTSGCFQDGGVLGKIPASRLYSTGLAILNRYPLPSTTQAVNTNFNLEIPRPQDKNLTQQPAIRVDYQFSPTLRITGKFSGERQRQRTVEGTMPGFNDVLVPYPYISNYGFTANYTLNPTTFIEATYGSIKNELAGGGSGGILVNPSANRLSPDSGLADLPLLYPDAGVVDPRYYQLDALQRTNAVYFDGSQVSLPPNFAWGTRVGAGVPNQQYPGWLNVNKTQDFAASVTKVAGHHTMKAGFYQNHSFKAQNTGAGGIANLSFQGYLNFGEDTNNPLDAQFGYANAALGTFAQYLQQSRLIEGSMIYNNVEFYAQDNWKVTNRLTLDYGLRFTHQGPQYDQFGQMSNFFPDQWDPAAAPALYTPGCLGGAATCSGANRVAVDPNTGLSLGANSGAAIGTVVPDSGNRTNGIRLAGDGIVTSSYKWPALVFGPRFGAAYDLSGDQRMVVRGGFGLFYDRPDGNTVFSIPGNPPIADSQDLRFGQLQTLGTGLSTVGVPALSIFQYDAQVPSSLQWNVGIQTALPWSSSLDVSYVGSHGYNLLGGYQASNAVNLNAVDIGTAFLPQFQDPTLGASATPGANALTTNLLRPYRGYSTIAQQVTDFHDLYHSIQTSFNRRFANGFQFGASYTLGLSYTGNVGLQKRLQHNPDGSFQIRDDQAAYEDLNKNLDNRRHFLKANAVWDMPDIRADSGAGHAIGYILNDWQLSGVLTAGSGSHYDITYSYQDNGGNVNLTGSPDYAPRILFVGDPGSGCSDSQFAQFNTSAVTGPQLFSTGLESGRNQLVGCPDHTVDLALARNIRLGGGRQVQLRLDAFNVFNVAILNARQAQIQFNSPTDLSLRNSQTLEDGTLDPSRSTPRTAGFGAATGAQTMRTLQLTARFSF